MDRYDVVIVGGGPAGLSAALMLGRSRRSVLLVDGSEPRSPSHAAHNFFTRDGEHPLELRRIGRDQLAPYTTVRIEDREAVAAGGEDGAFRIRFADGGEVEARKVILATGIRDVLPLIEGFRDLWGRSAFTCPFCDGWEVRDKAWAVLAPSPDLAHVALLATWTSDLVVLTNGHDDLDVKTRTGLAGLGIPVRTEPIARFEGEDGRLRQVVFDTGERLARSVLLVRPEMEPRTTLALQLGCDLVEAGPIPGLIQVDAMQQTTTPGVFAAGDVTTPMHQIAIAVSTGVMAAAMINHQFVQERLAALAAVRPLASAAGE